MRFQELVGLVRSCKNRLVECLKTIPRGAKIGCKLYTEFEAARIERTEEAFE